jgi:hypothetical protein
MKRQLSGPILTPTFNTDDPDAYVVFNNYGDLGEGIGPVVFAHMLGWVSRRIDFSVEDMWVNHDDTRGIRSGHLITPSAEDFADLPSLHLSVSRSLVPLPGRDHHHRKDQQCCLRTSSTPRPSSASVRCEKGRSPRHTA